MNFYMRSRVPKKLQDEWNAKLKSAKFKDLESPENRDGYIQHEIFSIYSPYLITPFKAEQMQKLLETYKFAKPRDKEILKLHLDGHSTRSIQRRIAAVWPEISQQRISQLVIQYRKLAENI